MVLRLVVLVGLFAALRKRAGNTQAELASRLGTTQGGVSAIERSPDPKLSTLRRHVAALGATLRIEIQLGDEITTVDT